MPNAQTAICIEANYKIPTTMGLLDSLNHVLNFIAPAVVVGVLLAYGAPFLNKNMAVAHARYAQAAINSVAGIVALSVGLWLFGRDGKMASYGAMVVATATSQWFLCLRR
jgi:hypothetical protein